MVTIELDRELSGELEDLNTVADRIRLLDSKGYQRADIARVLGKRYQHVRNVLEQDKRKTKPKPKPLSNDMSLETTMFNLTISSAGQINIPSILLNQLNIGPGREVVVSIKDSELYITPVMTALRKAQALVQSLVPADDSMADELIDDRRREARTANNI